jgi:hypothetical protein
MKRLMMLAVIASTALTHPATADDGWSRNDRNRLIVGATILGMLALGLNDRGQRAPAPTPQPGYQPQPVSYLPGACATTYNTANGRIGFVNGTCLEQSYVQTAALPLDCALTLRINGAYVGGFDPTCLSARGYRLSGS